MNYLYSLLFGLLNAIACSQCAKRRGRNPLHWFIWGAFFGVFALIALFLLPARRARVYAPSAPLKVVPPPPLLQITDPALSDKLWYYLDQNKQQYGPLSLHALSKAWGDGKIHMHSLVWNDALENWKRLDEVASGLHSSRFQ